MTLLLSRKPGNASGIPVCAVLRCGRIDAGNLPAAFEWALVLTSAQLQNHTTKAPLFIRDSSSK